LIHSECNTVPPVEYACVLCSRAAAAAAAAARGVADWDVDIGVISLVPA
jgi:hypothetical protein